MTMSRFEALARRLVLVLGLGVGAAACGGDGPLPAPSAPPSSDPVTTTGDPAPAATPAPVETPAPAEMPVPVAAPAATPTPVPRTRAELEAEADAGLARLRALQVVEVNGLILDLPAAAKQCYGLCWNDPMYADAIVAAYEDQLPRLAKLAEIGEGVIKNSYPALEPVERAPNAIAWLESLQIVDLGQLLTVAPKNNPSCYNLPCQSDIVTARTTNESRSWFVERWAQLASNPKP